MATKTKPTSPKPAAGSASKDALDAYGGDPLAPNDVMLQRIAAAIADEEDDEMVNRWAEAFDEVCSEPNTPKRQFLAKVVATVQGGDADEEVKAWAEGQGIKQTKSEYSLDHLGT